MLLLGQVISINLRCHPAWCVNTHSFILRKNLHMTTLFTLSPLRLPYSAICLSVRPQKPIRYHYSYCNPTICSSLKRLK